MIVRDLERILSAASSLDEDLYAEFAESLAYLAHVLESPSVSSAKKAFAISAIGKHISKRAAAVDPDNVAEVLGSLRELRNELAHGKLSKRRDFSKYYSKLWSAISKASDEVHPSDIENLLAYSMDVRNQQLAEQGAPSSKVALSYKRKFHTLSAEDKQKAFIEILLTFFSDKRFLSALDRRRL